jgi:hypothetical protein
MASVVLGSVALGAVLFLLLHVVIWRAFPSNDPRILSLGGLGLVGIGTSILSLAFLRSLNLVAFFDVVAFDLFWAILYLFVYAGLSRSVSITLLARLLESGPRAVDLGILSKEYSESSRFEDRIQLMHENGLLQIKGNSVKFTTKGLRLARGSQWLSHILSSSLDG